MKKYSNLDDLLLDITNALDGVSHRQKCCIEILCKWCDGVQLDTQSKKIWHFYFDDGAYKGGWHFSKRQKDINTSFVCLVAHEVGWPGLKCFLNAVEKATVEIIENAVTEEPFCVEELKANVRTHIPNFAMATEIMRRIERK